MEKLAAKGQISLKNSWN